MAFLLTVMGWLGETVIKNLIEKVWDKMKELGSHDGEGAVGDALSDLKISLCRIRPIITETENMWIKDRDLRKNVNELVVQLKDAAYDAEDLLDKFEFQKLQQQIKQQGNEASDASSSSSSLSFLSRPVKKRKVVEYNDRDDVAEIRKIREKLNNINISMDKLLSTDTRGKVQMINEINRVTSSIPVETQVFGRDNELNELISLLLEPDQGESGSRSSSNICVLTVTGLGGVGKTTLAQEAYNDQRVEEYFELRMWVCVSEDFSVERLTKQIIESATKHKYDPSNFDALQVVLKEKTTSKKFLLVLDDVWNEDRHMWDTLCAPLRSGATGSKILVTTRDEKIANMVGSMNPIHLNGLDDENSWALFKKYAFGSQNSRDHPQLEDIAKNMVPMLKGLPLAARTLGGLLNKKMNEQHWRTIMHSEIWKLPQEENGVLLVLQVSYQYLPAYLKRCFAFCSLYPKDYQFREDVVVRIWMAEGFFPAQENITMEDFGSDCFQELVSRSFFQKSQHPNRYVMHDLIHDLAELISGKETYRLENVKSFEIPTMLRHLSMVKTAVDKELSRMDSQDFNKLRTLIYQRPDEFVYLSMNPVLLCGFFNRLQSIRTLILKYCGRIELPETIGDFIHLRYLDVTGNLLKKLPNSLCKLYNLQALILKWCDLNELPDSIGNLFYLRFLNISYNRDLNKLPESLCRLSNLQALKLVDCYGLQSLPQGTSRLTNLRKLEAHHPVEITEVGKLTSLQSLFPFKVGKEHGLKLAELSGLTQLHGTLTITNLENVESKEEAIAAKLHSKEHLDVLVLKWSKKEEVAKHLQPNSTTDQDNDAFFVSEEVLEHLQPNPAVKILTIKRYSGARSPSWLEEQSLSKFHLVDCKRWEDLSFIRFPCLSILHIHNCPLLNRLSPLPPSLTLLILDKVGLIKFPGIQKGMGGSSSNIVSPLEVQICQCPNLTSLDGIECFPCLKSLDIKDCPLLRRLPPLPPSLVKLEIIEVGLTELPGIGGSSSNIAIISPLEMQMQIRGCPNLTSLDIIDCFPCLKYLDIEDCPLLTRLPPLPPSLVGIQLSRVGLTELPGIGGSSSNIAIISPLEMQMQIRGCPNLTSLDIIDCFPCLKYLDIEDCPLLTRLPPLPPSLVGIQLSRVGLTELPGIRGSSCNITLVSLSRLHIKECSSMISLEQGLLSCNLPKLATIFFENCGELQRMLVNKFKQFTYFSSLSIVNCPKLMSMAQDDDIHLLLPPSVQTLNLSNCGKVDRSLPGCLHNLTTLTKLELCDCPHFVSLSREALLHLERLESLHLLNCKEMISIEGLGVLKSLKKLRIRGCPRLQLNEGDGQGENICSLVELDVNNTALLKVSPLRSTLPSIKSLIIECSLEVNMFEGEDHESLRSLTSLEYLKFYNCKNLQSLSMGLHNLPSLKLLDIDGCTQIQSLPKKGLPSSLINIRFFNCHATLEKQLEEHLAEMKRSGRFRNTEPWEYICNNKLHNTTV